MVYADTMPDRFQIIISITDRQLNVDGRSQFDIRCHCHMALVLFGHDIVGEREALANV